MPKAFSEREKQVILERLFERGSALFATQGIKKTTIEELAQAAGISKAAFYIFYESKEVLFMDVVERAEEQYRKQMLAMIAQPGPSPRARLSALFRNAFALVNTIPVLRYFSSSEYDLIFRRVPEETVREHLSNDMAFIIDLVNQCRAAGIPIQISPEEMSSLMYMLFFAMLHQNDFGTGNLAGPLDTLIELISAYCLGEVTMEKPGHSETNQTRSKEEHYESGH